jgi:putative membrane protein
MKKFHVIVLLPFAAILLNGCHSNKDSKEKADSTNTHQDSIHNKEAGTGDWVVSAPDAKFAVEAANGGMAEVELGKLAQAKGNSKAVKDFGAMMVTDHSKANMELKELARQKKIVLPDSVGKEEADLKISLSAKSNADFDKAYVDAMVDDHKKDIPAFENARVKVKYPEMKALIEKAIPMLKMHLSAIEKIQAQIK